MEAVEETTTQAAVEKLDESPPSQTITRVTKKKVKYPAKVVAGALGAKVRNHDLCQRLLNDLQSQRVQEPPVKEVETPAETDWSMLAIGAATGLFAFFKTPPPPPEPVKQIIHKQEVSQQAPLALFYME